MEHSAQSIQEEKVDSADYLYCDCLRIDFSHHLWPFPFKTGSSWSGQSHGMA